MPLTSSRVPPVISSYKEKSGARGFLRTADSMAIKKRSKLSAAALLERSSWSHCIMSASASLILRWARVMLAERERPDLETKSLWCVTHSKPLSFGARKNS